MLSENFVAKKKSDNESFPHVHRVIPSEVEESSFAASGDSSTSLGMTHRLKLSWGLYGGISLPQGNPDSRDPQGRHDTIG